MSLNVIFGVWYSLGCRRAVTGAALILFGRAGTIRREKRPIACIHQRRRGRGAHGPFRGRGQPPPRPAREEEEEGDPTASFRALVSRLQMALMAQGRIITMNQFQAYSETTGRVVTKFVISEKRAENYVKIFESWQLAEIVKFLAAEVNGGDG